MKLEAGSWLDGAGKAGGREVAEGLASQAADSASPRQPRRGWSQVCTAD